MVYSKWVGLGRLARLGRIEELPQNCSMAADFDASTTNARSGMNCELTRRSRFWNWARVPRPHHEKHHARLFRSTSTSILGGIVASLFVLLGTPDSRGREPDVQLARDVRSILSENCFHCHGPDASAREADLRLDRREDLFSDRGGYAVVTDGSLEDSELFQRITSDDVDLKMPPADAKLSLRRDQIDTIAEWIKSGAAWNEHWAYDPVRRPIVPVAIADSMDLNYEGPRNAIDFFILSRLSDVGLKPSPPATKHRLLRRVSLDLTGLPPELSDLDAFLADTAPGAYRRAVDRLLASPSYGERMVWEWLDAARYADSSGFQGDPERTMWPWRDGVVQALNANMSFDQFTIEQLAGDLLPDATQAQRIASGFNRNHMHNGEGGRIAEETRVENVFDRVETTATVWMGLTWTCARCHGHKYDPFTQEDYYRLAAFFNNTSENGGGRGGQNAPVMTYRTARDHATIAAANQRLDEVSASLAVAEAEQFTALADHESTPDKVRDQLRRPPIERDVGAIDELLKYFQESHPDYARQLGDHKSARQRRDELLARGPKVMIMDELTEPRETFILSRGLYNKRGRKVTADVPVALPPLGSAAQNRLSLAKWLVTPDHPLTSRVIVNRIWQSFFGRGLVASTENFGVQGEKPTHPDLLDWLAVEFIESGWDVKRLHRLIVNSATYRQTSQVRADLLERDPRNVYLARGARYRLPSWVLRDHALAVSGLLVDSMGGPSVKPYQPDGIWAEATFGKKKYQQDGGANLYRRSMYTFWRRIVGPPMFFDSSKRQTCEVKTALTNTPLHALNMLNDVTYIEAARTLAQQVLAICDLPSTGISHAFRRVTARVPTDDELTMLVNRFHDLRDRFSDDRAAARDLLTVGASPRDKSLDQSDHAAMTSICLLLLNLDETLTHE